ncbi:M10 family metallopeptidase [Pseudaestuariivita atlantica]|uniref:M10 family metallopeptidase n=1 Tax=Pseudaestuariivita atlantica TaxID=1317121 RepID=UPI00067E3B52|nr:M10 family metallopeptidase [Pseudaestuariivita atlantica]
MAATTTTSNVTYNGSNVYIDALFWGGAWSSPGPGTLIEYFLQSGADPFNFNGITNAPAWSASDIAALQAAMQTWMDVANITFSLTNVANDADIWYWQGPVNEVQALGWHEVPDTNSIEPLYGVFAFNADGWTPQGLQPGGYGFLTLVHEIGHGLGLAHPHDFGGNSGRFPGVTAEFDDYGDFNINQGIFTVQSYNDGWPTQYPQHSVANGFENYGYASTPMALDIAAIQAIYGANMNHNTGNDTYTLPDSNGSGTAWMSIWDAGGTDMITAAGSTRDFTIDLRAATLVNEFAGGYVSFSDGIVGGLTIANNVVIENARGGEGDDTINGNDTANTLEGNGGGDSVSGLGGNDMLMGNAGDDMLQGGAGNDTLDGGAGGDALDGGTGYDIASYESATRSVRVDLQNPSISFGDAVGDSFMDIEEFQTGGGIDQLRGDAGDNIFRTGGVSDRLYGRAGDDMLFGEAGADAFYGGLGADIMTAGDDAGRRDRFIYFNAAESGVGAGNRDVITDFVSGEDRIELSRIDADTTQGFKQAFTFVGSAAFSGTAGELRYEQSGGATIVQADRDGDGAADFEIELTGTMTLQATDFLI